MTMYNYWEYAGSIIFSNTSYYNATQDVAMPTRLMYGRCATKTSNLWVMFYQYV